MPSQRSGTRLPTRDEQKFIQQEFRLWPIEEDTPQGRRIVTTRNPWQDADDVAKQQKFAGELIQKLRDAVHLKYEQLKSKRQAPVLPMASLQGAADAAKRVVDEAFGDWRAQAVLPPKKQPDPTGPGGKITLRDSSSDADRQTKDTIISARRMAEYLALQDKWAQDLMKAHDFEPNYARATADERRFFKDLMDRFVELDTRLLYECDRLGYNLARPGSGKIFVLPFAEGWDGRDETDGPAMQKKYDVFKHVIHEYIHLLEHPLITPITSQNITVCEGLCEWLTCQVISGLALDDTAIGTADYIKREQKLKDIVQTIERADILQNYPGRAQALGKYLRQYKPAANYAGFVESVEKVAAICGDNGLRAAYFQGHLEYLGLSWAGYWLDGAEMASDGTRSIPAPRDDNLSNIDRLASAIDLPRALIMKYNPELVLSAGAVPKRFFLPGYHGHLAIVVGDDELAETWDQISAQHGVSVKRLREANLCGPEDGVWPRSWLFVPYKEG
jgi:hypothetical protein